MCKQVYTKWSLIYINILKDINNQFFKQIQIPIVNFKTNNTITCNCAIVNSNKTYNIHIIAF